MQAILPLAYVGLRQRDCSSIVNRFDFQKEDLDRLYTVANEYFRTNVLLLPTAVNPTIWMIGHVVPVHATEVYEHRHV